MQQGRSKADVKTTHLKTSGGRKGWWWWGGGATVREEKIGFGDKLRVHSPTRENSWTALHAYERGIVLALPCFAEPCSQNPGVRTAKLH